ncbi:MAG: cytidylate kinase, partial [Anaerolineae bacterium]
DYDEILARLIERDRIDSTREVAPLRPAEDAIIVNSDQMDAEAVFQYVLTLTRDP